MAESYRVGRILGVRLLLEALRNPDEGMLEAIGVGPDETGYAEWLYRAYFDHILNEEAE